MIGKFLLYLSASILRLWLMKSSLGSTIAGRVEVSTPINSWIRVKEGVFLYSQDVPVYSGGVFHGTPICLFLSGFLIRSWSDYLPYIFILIDLFTAAVLSKVALEYSRMMIERQHKERQNYSLEAKNLLLNIEQVNYSVLHVPVVYLFSPYIVLSCVAQTTTVFANAFLAISLLAMVKGNALLFGACIAVATYQNFYPVCLLVPGVLLFSQSSASYKKVVTSLFTFLAVFTILLLVSVEITGSWQFFSATYGFILLAPDLTPNIGLFWYFFTEMFEHFRLFFLATFQINAFVYVLPLATRLRKDPVLLAMALLALTAVFKSYPSLGDVGFYLALLPMWSHLYSYLRQTFIVGCMLVVTSVLGPIMYNLWIFNGSANANFYFAVTLAFNTAQIFLVTDILFAHVKRQYHLFNGSKMEVEGKQGRLTLE